MRYPMCASEQKGRRASSPSEAPPTSMAWCKAVAMARARPLSPLHEDRDFWIADFWGSDMDDVGLEGEMGSKLYR